jgi:hypothetical protein
MALFFLHIRDGPAVAHDPEGSDLPDLAAARTEAIQSARELMSQGVLDKGRLGIDRLVEIADEAGQVLLCVPFREAICEV